MMGFKHRWDTYFGGEEFQRFIGPINNSVDQ